MAKSWCCFIVLGLFLSSFSAAQGGRTGVAPADELAATQNPFKFEPTAAETVRHALDYFKVSPEKFEHLRASAKNRAFLPTLALGYRYYDLSIDRNEVEDFQPIESDIVRNDKYNSATVGAIWDFRQLIFNPAEVQVYGLVGVQRDVMLEVVRTYFLRRQLVLRLALRPPQEPLARASLELRIDEFTAILDVLSGAWFSQETIRRRSRSEKIRERRGSRGVDGGDLRRRRRR